MTTAIMILGHLHLVQLIWTLILRCVCVLWGHHDVLYKQSEAEDLQELGQSSVVDEVSAVVVNQSTSATNPPLLVDQDVSNLVDQDASNPQLLVDRDVDSAMAVVQPVDVAPNQDLLPQL